MSGAPGTGGAALPDKKYSVILADPPWDYKQKGGPKGKRGMAAAHYNTMTTEEICALPVKNMCGGGVRCLLSMGDVPEHRGGAARHGGLGV